MLGGNSPLRCGRWPARRARAFSCLGITCNTPGQAINQVGFYKYSHLGVFVRYAARWSCIKKTNNTTDLRHFSYLLRHFRVHARRFAAHARRFAAHARYFAVDVRRFPARARRFAAHALCFLLQTELALKWGSQLGKRDRQVSQPCAGWCTRQPRQSRLRRGH